MKFRCYARVQCSRWCLYTKAGRQLVTWGVSSAPASDGCVLPGSAPLPALTVGLRY